MEQVIFVTDNERKLCKFKLTGRKLAEIHAVPKELIYCYVNRKKDEAGNNYWEYVFTNEMTDYKKRKGGWDI